MNPESERSPTDVTQVPKESTQEVVERARRLTGPIAEALERTRQETKDRPYKELLRNYGTSMYIIGLLIRDREGLDAFKEKFRKEMETHPEIVKQLILVKKQLQIE